MTDSELIALVHECCKRQLEGGATFAVALGTYHDTGPRLDAYAAGTVQAALAQCRADLEMRLMDARKYAMAHTEDSCLLMQVENRSDDHFRVYAQQFQLKKPWLRKSLRFESIEDLRQIAQGSPVLRDAESAPPSLTGRVIDTSGSDAEMEDWIRANLIPDQGQADSVQGELVRAIDKLRHEAQCNGNINWDHGFEIMLDFLESKLGLQEDLERLRNFLPPDEFEDGDDPSALPCIDDDVYDRLSAQAIAFARRWPAAIAHHPHPYLYR